MAIAGSTAPALRLRYHNRAMGVIAITHAENRPTDTLEQSAAAALAALEVQTMAWIKAADADLLRGQGYIVKPLALLRLTPAEMQT